METSLRGLKHFAVVVHIHRVAGDAAEREEADVISNDTIPLVEESMKGTEIRAEAASKNPRYVAVASAAGEEQQRGGHLPVGTEAEDVRASVG